MQHVVISPGSRNAPLILGFTSHPKYKCYSIPDERTAGFIALGMADHTQTPVALICSSGTALLNYYPAIAEAFYRKIPLIVLSADRPEHLIDQGDGQTIRQQNVFHNHILFSTQLNEYDSKKSNEEIINRGLNIANSVSGPVHINIPFEEPLYNKVNFIEDSSKIISPAKIEFLTDQYDSIIDIWNKAKRILILVGQKDKDNELSSILEKVNSHALILSETTSNIEIDHTIKNIDRLITPFTELDQREFQPDLLITFGGNVVSKRIKGYLRSFPPQNHIHIENSDSAPNTYQCLTHHVKATPIHFFNQIIGNLKIESIPWTCNWIKLDTERTRNQYNYLKTIPFTDLKVMQTVRDLIPENSILHLANSTPVRYAQLFNWKPNLEFKSNRGASGIDGIVSTAMGNAITTNKQVFLVIGDISFFYDTNAWWHRHIPNNLKVIVINNDGGGIFRFIDGPNSTGQLENYFETRQKNSVKHIALGFEVDYFCASNLVELETEFLELSNSKSSGILEVSTPQTVNAGILKEYFKKLKE